MIIRTKAYARIGLMGNPSDGYLGRTIACAITNFNSEVTLWESPSLRIIPNPNHDPIEFDSLNQLQESAGRDGYYGGLRLILATCKKFNEYCQSHNIALEGRNFTISYSTNIPRQVGLGGSSAIITAAIKALMQFHGLTEEEIPKPIQPSLALSVETEELKIHAGLQDRVIQAYGGCVFMDFSTSSMEKQGHGEYEYLDSSLIPSLCLAHLDRPTDSGAIHSTVKYRYEQNDPEILCFMQTIADLTSSCKQALSRRNSKQIGELMNENFNLRRRMFGDAAIGEKNLEMISIARSLGCPSKFPGSGGAVVVMYQSEEELNTLEETYREHGFKCEKLAIDPGY